MKNHLLVLWLVTAIMSIGGNGCKHEIDASDFVGTWVNTASRGHSWKSITLNQDGTAELVYWNNNTAGPCTWRLKSLNLIVSDKDGRVLIDLRYRLPGRTKLVLEGTPENIVMTGDGTYLKQ